LRAWKISLKDYPELNNFLVISDEVSWNEGSYLVNKINDLNQLLKTKKVILVNPQVYKGTVFKKNIVAVASLNPSILVDMAILFDESSFIKYIRNYNGKKK